MITSLSLPAPFATPAAPAAAPAPTQAASSTAGFAQALHAAEAPKPGPASEDASAPSEPNATQTTTPARTPAAARPVARSQSGAGAPAKAAAPAEAAEPADIQAGIATPTTALATDEKLPAEPVSQEGTPSLQALLSALQPPHATTPEAAWGERARVQPTANAETEPPAGRGPVRGLFRPEPDTTAAGDPPAGRGPVRGLFRPEPDATAAGDPPASRGPVRGLFRPDPETSTATSASSPAAHTGLTLAASGTESTLRMAEASTATALPAAASDPAPQALANLATLLPQASSPAAAGGLAASAAPAAQAQISASPGSPAFAPELGAQISTFARHGVEHAQLQLHPAEMGPVTVQILVEGASAQVRLWAEQPGTRLALEQAMPSLAGQLREGGLTLTGGGVFEQAQQTPEQAWREARAQGGTALRDAAEPATLATATPTRRRGVVDLIA